VVLGARVSLPLYVERSIRQTALIRTTALFAGSDRGAEHWALVASLIESCNLNAIDP